MRRGEENVTLAGLRRGALSFGAAALLWERVARWVDNKLFLVPLGAIAERAVELYQSGELMKDIEVSFVEFAGGFLLAAFVGIAVGVILAASRMLRDFFDPWISMLYATPTLALGQVVTRAVRLQGVTGGSLRAFEDMMRAIAMHRLEPAFSVVGHAMEDAPSAIAAIAEGAHFGKLCITFGGRA